MSKVAVIGAGVVGLTTAVELASKNSVVVMSDQDILSTTSATATAVWHVYLVDPNDPRVLRWGAISLAEYLRFANEYPESGVTTVRGIELFRMDTPETPETPETPVWRDIPPFFRMCPFEELKVWEGVLWGYEIEAPLANMDIYLPWLVSQAVTAGVVFERRTLSNIDDVGDEFDVVVNCAGLRARSLVGDKHLRPVRGQYLIVEKWEGCPANYVGDDQNPGGMTYVIPRMVDVCIGGTEEHDVDRLVFEVDENALLSRAAAMFPSLPLQSALRVRRRVVGLRPFREGGVRLEAEIVQGHRPVIHNYGHGGSGFSLAWGCAREVALLADELLHGRDLRK